MQRSGPRRVGNVAELDEHADERLLRRVPGKVRRDAAARLVGPRAFRGAFGGTGRVRSRQQVGDVAVRCRRDGGGAVVRELCDDSRRIRQICGEDDVGQQLSEHVPRRARLWQRARDAAQQPPALGGVHALQHGRVAVAHAEVVVGRDDKGVAPAGMSKVVKCCSQAQRQPLRRQDEGGERRRRREEEAALDDVGRVRRRVVYGRVGRGVGRVELCHGVDERLCLHAELLDGVADGAV
mmetsp:Transcript_13719/g.45760  ORF Transcript_13719/g.45760 Transcript_13719/m.45760 type:complete len:238 (+) Transcript_13719:1097-1810(+)